MVGRVDAQVQHDDVVYLLLNRPSSGNALDPDTVDRLHRELSVAEANPNCLAVVLQAEGPAFCAGADVQACKELMKSPADLLAFFDKGRRLMERLVASRLMSIAVVNGLAAAGGLELVSAVDVVIATESAKFADRHANFGFLPAFGATSLLPVRVGRGVATSILLGTRELDAHAAYDAGLVHRVCSPDEIMDVVEEELNQLRNIGVGALADMKSLINVMEPLNFEPEIDAVRDFSEMGGYDPTRFITRKKQDPDSSR